MGRQNKGIEALQILMSQVYGVHTALGGHNGLCTRVGSSRTRLLDDFHVALSSESEKLKNGLRLDLEFCEHDFVRTSEWHHLVDGRNQVYQFITVLKLPFLWLGMDWLHGPLCGATNLQYLAFKLATRNLWHSSVNRNDGYSPNAVLPQSLTYCAAIGAWPKLRKLELCNPCCPALIQNLLAKCSSAVEHLHFTSVDCVDMNLDHHERMNTSAWRGLCNYIRSTPRFRRFEIDFHRYPPSSRAQTGCRCSWGRTGGARNPVTNIRNPPIEERLAQEAEVISQAAYAIQRDL
jgi:hypothetical protein